LITLITAEATFAATDWESAVPQDMVGSEKMAMMGSSGFHDGFLWLIYMGRIELDTFFGIFGGYWDTIEKLIGGLEHDFEFSILLGMS